MSTKWANGNISGAGNISHAEIYTYQVITDIAISFPYSVTIKAKPNYKFQLKTFSNSEIKSANQITDFGNVLTFTVPANVYIGLIIKN